MNWIPIISLSNVQEAHIIMGMLINHNIQAVVKDQASYQTNTFGFSNNYAHVFVREQDQHKAKALLKAIDYKVGFEDENSAENRFRNFIYSIIGWIRGTQRA